MEDPHVLLRRLRLGREEYCQRLLTMLILDGSYPRWNTRSVPGPDGLAWLRALDSLSFGSSELTEDAVFVDELDLPARSVDEPGCAPDYAVFAGDRLWIIELKTERGSHRRGQIPAYFELGGHHYPNLRIDLTYLTPVMPVVSDVSPTGSRFAHLTWGQAIPLVREVWRDATGEQQAVRDALIEALGSMGTPWGTWRQTTLEDVTNLALHQARATAADGRQRALEYPAQSLEEMQELRVAVRDALTKAGQPGDDAVTPWLWNAQTSGRASPDGVWAEPRFRAEVLGLAFPDRVLTGQLNSSTASLTRTAVEVSDFSNIDSSPGWRARETSTRVLNDTAQTLISVPGRVDRNAASGTDIATISGVPEPETRARSLNTSGAKGVPTLVVPRRNSRSLCSSPAE